VIVLGGHYHITAGEALNEDISFYFAQVTIDEGAKVDGHIFLYSSTLDLRGDVTENIHAFESDLTLRASARVEGEIDEKDLIHWTLLLPAMTQLP
jgi:cytoskeletal protein CcmA (bactofilin family)